MTRRLRGTGRVVTVERMVEAPAPTLFAILRSPAFHVAMDGSGMLRGRASGPTLLGPGDTFSMSMRQFGLPYCSVNWVLRFEPDRLLEWETTAQWHGHRLVGGQRWRYELLHYGPRTLVRHSYRWGHARWPLLTVWLPGYPRRMARAMPASLARLSALADSVQARATAPSDP